MTIRAVQCLLTYLAEQAGPQKRKLYPGNIDGIFGGATRAAVTEFQKCFGLAADGYPGEETFAALRHAVFYGMDTAQSSADDSPQDADQYLKADGYYHISKGSRVRLSANFCSNEFDCQGAGCCSETVIDPKLVTYLQAVRDKTGRPVMITSGYRCVSHNSSVNGAAGSRHTKGDAADIVVAGTAPGEIAKLAEDIGVPGIGLYETAADGYFTHIDTRDYKSFWYGQGQAARTTFK